MISIPPSCYKNISVCTRWVVNRKESLSVFGIERKIHVFSIGFSPQYERSHSSSSSSSLFVVCFIVTGLEMQAGSDVGSGGRRRRTRREMSTIMRIVFGWIIVVKVPRVLMLHVMLGQRRNQGRRRVPE